jgi:hypothetical protein
MYRYRCHVLAYVAEPDTAGIVLELCAAMVAEVPCFQLEFAKRADVGAMLGIT